MKSRHDVYQFNLSGDQLTNELVVGMDRKVTSPIKLSDGKTVLPAGRIVAFPGGPMSRDPRYYDDPQRFDGFRFCRSNDREDRVNIQSPDVFTSIESGNLSWGNGRFTCPGRWFAAVMMKLLIANLLLEYEISYPDGQARRPANVQDDTETRPDFTQQVVFKKR